jgi:hypothetical protein
MLYKVAVGSLIKKLSIPKSFILLKPMQSRKEKGKLSFSALSRRQRPPSLMIYLLPLYVLLFGIGLVGCSNSIPIGFTGFNIGSLGINFTKIRDIPQNPDADATAYLQGQVISRAPLMGSGAYKLKDATGTIWVFTNQTLPNLGDQVLIKGQLRFQSIPISGQELGEVYVQEQQQLERKAGQPEQSVSSPEPS